MTWLSSGASEYSEGPAPANEVLPLLPQDIFTAIIALHALRQECQEQYIEGLQVVPLPAVLEAWGQNWQRLEAEIIFLEQFGWVELLISENGLFRDKGDVATWLDFQEEKGIWIHPAVVEYINLNPRHIIEIDSQHQHKSKYKNK